jgi:hypothetical protein
MKVILAILIVLIAGFSFFFMIVNSIHIRKQIREWKQEIDRILDQTSDFKQEEERIIQNEKDRHFYITCSKDEKIIRIHHRFPR